MPCANLSIAVCPYTMGPEGVPPELEEEVEVVQAIYGDDAVRTADGTGVHVLRVLVDLQPRVEQGSALVSATVSVSLPAGYPATELPQFAIERSRGLSDGALATLVQAADRAIQEHGLQEIGCISQVLAEVSDALDVANDTSECSICLSICGIDEQAVRAACDHIFHSSCIGYWSELKAEEVEATAQEVNRSAVAERDSLLRELTEVAEAKDVHAPARVAEAQKKVSICTQRVDAARAKLKPKRPEDEDEANTCPVGLEEDGDEPDLEELVQWTREAKADLQTSLAEERRLQGRYADLERRHQALEAELSADAASRAAASLPCPVCRAPIERSLLSRGKGVQERKKCMQGPVAGSAEASVDALPAELTQQVRTLQRQHAERLQQQRCKAAEQEIEACLGGLTSTAVTSDVMEEADIRAGTSPRSRSGATASSGPRMQRAPAIAVPSTEGVTQGNSVASGGQRVETTRRRWGGQAESAVASGSSSGLQTGAAARRTAEREGRVDAAGGRGASARFHDGADWQSQNWGEWWENNQWDAACSNQWSGGRWSRAAGCQWESTGSNQPQHHQAGGSGRGYKGHGRAGRNAGK